MAPRVKKRRSTQQLQKYLTALHEFTDSQELRYPDFKTIENSKNRLQKSP
jgi:hypothetical protein